MGCAPIPKTLMDYLFRALLIGAGLVVVIAVIAAIGSLF